MNNINNKLQCFKRALAKKKRMIAQNFNRNTDVVLAYNNQIYETFVYLYKVIDAKLTKQQNEKQNKL